MNSGAMHRLRTVPTADAPIPPRTGGCYEMKFPLDPGQAAAIEAWAIERIPPDPHADPTQGGAYRVCSLYLDTPGLEILGRFGGYGDCKFRVRRYNDETLLYLEQKERLGGRIYKRRSAIDGRELEPALEAANGSAAWFRRLCLENGLAPQCVISYRRLARVAVTNGSPLRLTLDRDVSAAPVSRWEIGAGDGSGAVALDGCVLELKFHTALPSVFKALLREFRLTPQPSSKYRRAMRHWVSESFRVHARSA
jgi:hypothetical protein